MSKQVYISADYAADSGDKDVVYFLKYYTKNGQLDLSAMWNEIANLKTKVEFIKASDDYYEIPIGENIVLVEKADLSWE